MSYFGAEIGQERKQIKLREIRGRTSTDRTWIYDEYGKLITRADNFYDTLKAFERVNFTTQNRDVLLGNIDRSTELITICLHSLWLDMLEVNIACEARIKAIRKDFRHATLKR